MKDRLLILSLLALVVACNEPSGPTPVEVGQDVARPTPPDAPLGWLVSGGGSAPDSNQVSIERDLGLAAEIFGGPGKVLFAGGPGSDGVQIQKGLALGDPLLTDLGQIFDPEAGPSGQLPKTELSPAGPATAGGTLDAFAEALHEGRTPFLLYIAGHGNIGRVPAENVIMLWGGDVITPIDLARVLDEHPQRQTRLVLTSCFSGGFAEIVFRDANPLAGAAQHAGCGFFASKWNQESSGCDPNPDRRKHEGYGVHFLNALRGQDRHGADQKGLIDSNGDGRISLMEADSWARVSSKGIDVPTRTSEWWLRSVAPLYGPDFPAPLAEDDATVAGLQKRLGRATDPAAATAKLLAFDIALRSLAEVQLSLADREAALYRQLGADLLAIWPVLNDPWHPLFRLTLDRDGKKIRRYLDESPLFAELAQLGEDLDAVVFAGDGIRVERAPYERLLRIYDNRYLAGLLRARGGPDWDRYTQLLECERGFVP